MILATVKKECDLTGQYLCSRSYVYHSFYGNDIADFNFHANKGDLIYIEAVHRENAPTGDRGYHIGINLYLNNTLISNNWIGSFSKVDYSGTSFFYTEIDFYLTSSIPKRLIPELPILIKFYNSSGEVIQPITINIPFPEINENYNSPFMISVYYSLLDSEKNLVNGGLHFSLDNATKSNSYDARLKIIPKIKYTKLGCTIELLGINGYDFKDSNTSYAYGGDYTELYFVLEDIKISRAFNLTTGIPQLNPDYNINVVEVIGVSPFINKTDYGSIAKNAVAIDGGIRFNCTNWDTFDSMSEMFANCLNITSIKFSNFININKILDMHNMFTSCDNLVSIDFSAFNLNTSSVQDMSFMFMNCEKLTSLDLSNFNTSSALNIDGMFRGCLSLVSIDLSNFDTSSVQSMTEMFCDCENLKSIICPNGLDMSAIEDESMVSDMFAGCTEFESPLHLKNVQSSLIVSGSSPDDWAIDESIIGGTRGVHYIVDSVI